MIELLQYNFFQNAIIASILVGILGGFIGTYIVNRRLVFIAGGLAHASMGGVGICALLSISPTLGASIFSLLSAFSIKKLSTAIGVKEDSAIAMLWAFGIGTGIMCSFMAPSFLPDLPNYIFGNVLLSTATDIIFLAILTLATVAFFMRYMTQITAISFDRDFASSLKLPVNLFENILMALVALSIVAILRSMGIVLAISLLSIPQITATIFAKKFSKVIAASIGITILDCLIGLAISIHFNVPSGASIVFVSVIIYIVCKTIKNIFIRLHKREHIHQH